MTNTNQSRYVEERARAIEPCACPRAPSERLAAPRCAVQLCPTPKPLLYVKGTPTYRCERALGFCNGYICTCENRLRVYRQYGL